VLHIPVEVATAFHPVVTHHLWTLGTSLLDIPLWEFFELITSGVDTTKTSPGCSDRDRLHDPSRRGAPPFCYRRHVSGDLGRRSWTM